MSNNRYTENSVACNNRFCTRGGAWSDSGEQEEHDPGEGMAD